MVSKSRVPLQLDPSNDNYYFAHRTWFDLKGYVMLGKYPVMPDNVYLSGEFVVAGLGSNHEQAINKAINKEQSV